MRALLLLLLSTAAWADLGSNFRVESYGINGLTYTWDRDGETVDTLYTIRRGGVIVRQSNPPAVNGNDVPLYYGERYTVTLQVNDGPESPPLEVALPDPPVANPGGELLYIVLSFADVPHHASAAEVSRAVLANVAWWNGISGGRSTWTPTIIEHTLSRPMADYTYAEWGLPDVGNTKAINDELVVALDLRNRLGLHRVLVDVEGHAPFRFNSGDRTWLGSDVWTQWISRFNFPHEIFHSYGLWHFGALSTIPADIDRLPKGTISYLGSEVMGSGLSPEGMSTQNMLTLGIRDYAQLVRVPAGGAIVTLANNKVANGVMGAVIPATPAGASYIVEYMEPYVQAVLRPTYSVEGFSLVRLGWNVSGRVLTDSARGITVDILERTADTATVRIVTPGAEPPPSPPPPAPPTVSVAITTPRTGAAVAPKSLTPIAAVTDPPGRPITWSASCGSIQGAYWKAPAAPNKFCRIVATAGTASANVTVRTGSR